MGAHAADAVVLDAAFEPSQPGVPLTYLSRYVQVRNAVRVEVEDSGVGISKEDQARLFAEFVRVKNEGPGLWEHADPPPIRFEPDGVFGGAESHVTSVAGAVVDGDANVYIYDGQLAELSAFSEEGAILWRAGSPGTAPDQFQGVRGIAYDGNQTMWVVNQDGVRVGSELYTGFGYRRDQ